MLFKKTYCFLECFHSMAQGSSCKYMAVNDNSFILIQRRLSGKDMYCVSCHINESVKGLGNKHVI